MFPLSQPQNKPPKGPEEGGRWAILGGVFDPVHSGHLTLAEDFLRTGRFDGILFVPSYNPPHKRFEAQASYEDRVNMLRLALEDHSQFVISLAESEMDAPGYTLNVVRWLKKRFPEAAFSFIMGADNIRDMKNWHQPEKIFEELPVLAGARPGYERPHSDEFPGDRIEFIPTSKVDVSATMIRERISEGMGPKELAQFLPEKVADYIVKRKLYR